MAFTTVLGKAGKLVPRNSKVVIVLVIMACLVNSMVLGYDGNMM